jgi:hypothetical protein
MFGPDYGGAVTGFAKSFIGQDAYNSPERAVGYTQCCPHLFLDVNGRPDHLLDAKNVKKPAVTRVHGRYWTSLDSDMVERRRIELPTFALRTRRSPS